MSFRRVLAVFVGVVVVSVVGCGALVGPHSGDPCDLATYRPRCTDGVALECSPGSDCSHHDCNGWGCSCSESPHIYRDDCNADGLSCVVDQHGARCE